MDSTSEGYANCNENMSNHITPQSAKRRRVEGTPGTLNNSAAVWNPSNTPSSWHNSESVWAIDRSGVVVSPFDMSMDQSIATAASQPQAFSLSKPYLPHLGNNGVYAEVEGFNDKKTSYSWFPAPGYESSTMMVSASWNTVTAAHNSSMSHCDDWNMSSRLVQTEPTPSVYQQQDDHRSLGDPSSVGLDPNYSAQLHCYGANSTQWSAPIPSNTLHVGVPWHTKTEGISQENLTTSSTLNLPYGNYGPAALVETAVETPSKVDENETVCFGMVGTVKSP
jgi:hypothetical protein